MGILDIFKKIISRATSGEVGEEPFEEEIGPELAEEKEEFPKEEGLEGAFGKEEMPEEKEGPLPEEKIEEPEEKEESTTGLREQLEVIKNKLELVDAHLKTIESKEDIYKIEADRYMQYLTFISEKIDHLERDLTEVERLIKKRE